MNRAEYDYSRKRDKAYRRVLAGLMLLVELDPPKNSMEGKFLGRAAKAADQFERERWPMGARKK